MTVVETAETGALLRGFDDYSVLLGDEMRGRRASMGKSLLDVEKEINIRARLIHCIEVCDPDGFEIKWIVPGHVRSYAKYLGMDPDDAFRRFCRESGFEALPVNLSGKPKPRSEQKSVPKSKRFRKRIQREELIAEPRKTWLTKQSIQALTSSMLVVFLFVGVGYVGWTVYSEIDSAMQTSTENAGLNLQSNDIVAETAVSDAWQFSEIQILETASLGNRKTMKEFLPGENGVFSNRNNSSPDTTAVVSMETDLAAAEPMAVSVEAIGERAPEIEVSTAGDQYSVDNASDIQLAVAGDPNEVLLLPASPVWVRIKRADDTVLQERVLPAGAEFSVPRSNEPLLLRAGNPGALYFVVGGEIYGPAGLGISVIKNVDLSAAAIVDRFARVESDEIPQEIQNHVQISQTFE